MQAFRTWFDARFGKCVSWAALATLMVFTLLAAFRLPLELAPEIGVGPFLEGKLSAKDWHDKGVSWFAQAYFVFDAVLFVPAYTIFFVGIALRLVPPALKNRIDQWLAAGVIVFTGLMAMVDEIENVGAIFAIAREATTWSSPTWLKEKLMLVPIGALLVLIFRWFFAVGLGRSADAAASVHLRRAVSDIVWRNRYNIVGLVLFGALIIVMDQSRDVLVGAAQALRAGVPQAAAAIVVMVFSAIALWVFAFTVWMSARILARLQRGSGGALFSDAAADPHAQVFAKWWARILGVTPILMLVWLCGFAARDAVLAEAVGSAWVLITFGALAVGYAGYFMVRRVRRIGKAVGSVYYEQTPFLLHPNPNNSSGPRIGELAPTTYTFFRMPAAPLSLPLLALVGMMIVRILELYTPGAPSMSFITICLGMTFWLGVVSVLTQMSLLYARPYIAGVLAVVILLGWFGWTDNHIVWSAVPKPRTADGLHVLLIYHVVLALIVVGAIGALYLYICTCAGRRRGLILIPLVAVLAFGVTLILADRGGPRSLAGSGPVRAASAASDEPNSTDAVKARKPLNDALTAWLEQLCEPGTPCSTQESRPLAVYFVATEGGGIRAAYWTALVLAELSRRIQNFDRVTFSISGVSGGAMGAAIYRACTLEMPDKLMECVQRLGDGHFLGPLLSTWMFEDILARVVPTYLCATPGCGLMSRGAWFEQAMEDVWEKMHEPIAASRLSGKAHVPYLLLNSTWVETGERAIASDLEIQPTSFPTARDQLAIMGKDLPLSTAAHNAARFPYVNAIGSLHTLPDWCPMVKRAGLNRDKPISCGHLADGGYFDNSGGHSTSDVLRALAILLARDGEQATPEIKWLRANLVPYVIMLRNGVEKKDEPQKASKGTLKEMSKEDPHSCGAVEPELPRCTTRVWLLTDLVGPAVTALNAVGTGANGRLAESLLTKEVLALRSRTSAAQHPVNPVVNIDLEKTGVLYPLGWYLSPTARKGMQDAACTSERYLELCLPGDERCRAQPQC
jgi:hypothetical protein